MTMPAAPKPPKDAQPERAQPERAQPGDAARRDEKPVLPTISRDDTDEGWGESSRGNDHRLREDRPPHWGAD